jgi:ATP-dependent DNA helicase RecQ
VRGWLSQGVPNLRRVTTRERAEALLQQLTGNGGAVFRPGQYEAIEALVVRRAPLLVVQRTGWGKSAVYFVATRMLRDAGTGPTLLISPLLALMRNQIEMARRAGVRAETLNSTNRDDWERIEDLVGRGEVDLLLISPERLNNPSFRREVLPALVDQVGLLVVDEAHCISDWGHDFRPDYRRIGSVLERLPDGVPVLCTTATANDRVVADIADQLGGGLQVLRGTLQRESLALSVLDLPSQSERLAWLAAELPELPGSGIVYCLTIADAERVAAWLRKRGIDALAYSGQSDNEVRIAAEDALLANEVKALVATSALGMGFDKPDLAFVVHYQSPGSPIAYYQQVGRAGRAIDQAVGILLRGSEDRDIQDHFITTAFPREDDALRVVRLLEEVDAPLRIAQIEQSVNVRRSRIEALLKVLEVEGAVERSGSEWFRTTQPWAYDSERVARVTELRRTEQAAMTDYGATSACRMSFLRAQLDDPLVEPCGRCDNCTGQRFDRELDPVLVAAAGDHLRGAALEIEPRRQIPAVAGAAGSRIAKEAQLMVGRALSRQNDGGWATAVRRAECAGQPYPDELVVASADLVTTWSPEPAPAWVTFVPASGPLDDFARRLGEALGLPVVDVVAGAGPRRPQAEMRNSVQQFCNVRRAFTVGGPVPEGPVLLVDDVVDSRWTLTVVGLLLRDAGSGPVHPFVLSRALAT